MFSLLVARVAPALVAAVMVASSRIRNRKKAEPVSVTSAKWWVDLDDAQFIAECRRRGVMYSCDAFGYHLASDQEIVLARAAPLAGPDS